MTTTPATKLGGAPTTDPNVSKSTAPSAPLSTPAHRSLFAHVPSYAVREFRRTVRMIEATFFIVALPTALHLMFGAISSYSDQQAGNGNVAAYNMTSMAVYGAAMATTSIAGSAAVERMKGWGRQLSLTGLTQPGYFLGKVIVALAMAVLAVAVVMGVGAATGAEFDTLGLWAVTFTLTVAGALPFAFYGLAAALLFRSEAAVSAASGGLVVLGFLGNLFVPLSGTLLEFARFTPMYGAGALARWPQLEGALLDIEMPVMTGIEATAALREAAPDCRVLIVTTFGRPGYLRRAMEAGAWGFVVKDTPSEELADAVRRVHGGERVMDPRLAQESLAAGANPLTERERDVLRACLDGSSVREIAAALFLSPGTVRNHLSNAIGKTHTENRHEAATTARDNGWL